MPKELMLSTEKELKEKSEGLEKFDVTAYNRDDELIDYLESFTKSLTEYEQAIIQILKLSQEALTMTQIRTIFTKKMLDNIFKKAVERKNFIDNQLVPFLAEFSINKADNVVMKLDYPVLFQFSPLQLENFILEYSPQIKSTTEQNKLKKIFSQWELDRLSKFTETERMDRARKLLSKHGFNVPSGDLIKSSLEYLKERGIVNYRIQNNVHLWSLEPKFFMSLNKVNRYLEDKEKTERKE